MRIAAHPVAKSFICKQKKAAKATFFILLSAKNHALWS